jgi:hypothetical protein
MSGTEFDPGAANTGEPYITDLTLPNTAASVKAGDYLNPTFRYFTALKSVTGDYIVSVHKVCYFADRPCIFSPNGCENAVFKEVCP